MIAFLIKSTLSLVVLALCYRFFFQRDKHFGFNRAFLLGSVLFALAAPLATLPWAFETPFPDPTHVEVTEGQTIEQTSSADIETPALLNPAPPAPFPWSTVIWSVYWIGFGLMFLRFFKNLWVILRLFRNGERGLHLGVPIVKTTQSFGPFSFGRALYINRQDLESGVLDDDILNHEKVHLQKAHTLDVLMLEAVLMFYWFNPVMWWYRKAIKANHEYEADACVVANKDNAGDYFRKVLNFSQPQSQQALGSNFSYSLTKSRIKMMNQVKSSPFAFGKKLLFSLFIAGSTLLVVGMRNNPVNSLPGPDETVFTVLIDAGHGGKDPGAHEEHLGQPEKDYVLAFVNAIKAENPDPSIRILFTRETDEFIDLRDRAAMTESTQADLFISLHVNSSENAKANGIEVFYADTNPEKEESIKFCQLISERIQMRSETKIKQGNFIVLRNAQCPAVLFNMGYMTNEEDRQFISNDGNLQALARELLECVSIYSKS